MNNDTNDFLFGGAGKAAKFENLGDMVEGTITEANVGQQTSLDDGTPLTWSDGSPRMQLVISLQTDMRDPALDNDDGMRRIFAKGGTYQVQTGSGSSMKNAIADAVKRSGARMLEEGATLKVAYTGEGVKTNRGYSAPKLFKASYTPPVKGVAMDDIFDD